MIPENEWPPLWRRVLVCLKDRKAWRQRRAVDGMIIQLFNNSPLPRDETSAMLRAPEPLSDRLWREAFKPKGDKLP